MPVLKLNFVFGDQLRESKFGALFSDVYQSRPLSGL